MASYKTSNLLYQETLTSYQSSMSQSGGIPLSEYCKKHHVYYHGMKRWMSDKKISIIAMRKSYSTDHSSSILPSPSSLVPICMTNIEKSEVSRESLTITTISKVKIIYPTGVAIEIENLPYTCFKDLLSLPLQITS